VSLCPLLPYHFSPRSFPPTDRRGLNFELLWALHPVLPFRPPFGLVVEGIASRCSVSHVLLNSTPTEYHPNSYVKVR